MPQNKFSGVSGELLRDSQKRTPWGSESQRVGVDTWKEREPNWRLEPGTWRSLDVEEHKALV